MVKLINICDRDEANKILEEYRRPIRRTMKFLIALMIVIAIAFIIMGVMRWDYVTVFWRDGLNADTESAVYKSLGTMIGAVLTLLFLFAFYMSSKASLYDCPNTICKYYELIDGKNILDVKLHKKSFVSVDSPCLDRIPKYWLEFEFEDENHVVDYDGIDLYDTETRTDVDEIVVDMARGVVCIPHNS